MNSEETPYTIVMGKYGPAHAVKQHSGRYVVCPRRADLCRHCKEDGVPLFPPDPFDAVAGRFRAHWHQRWFDLDRQAVPLPDNIIDEGQGVHIVARTDDCQDSTVLASFGADPNIRLSVSALVHVHNEMIGRPD